MAELTRGKVERIVKEAREKGEEPDLRRVDLSEVNLSGADLSRVNLSDAYLWRANFSKANLSKANLIDAEINSADLSGANLHEADLNWASLSEADLSRADLNGAHLSWVILNHANLSGADLSGAHLDNADLWGADLSEGNLNDADLINADLREADLHKADLNGAHLILTKFWQANLSTVNLTEAILSHTIFANVDLSKVKGLDTVYHRGPSHISTDTLNLSKGQIPVVFLRGCGLSDVQIEMAKLHNPNLTQDQITDITYKIHNLLTGPAISYYSCFISYSHKDEMFAEKIYTDLQENGVRCWYAPEDMKIGSRFRSAIDRNIGLHNKLLLILSEHSLSSNWVKYEVEKALDLEIQRDELILLPIKIDTAVMHSPVEWANDIKQSRHIGDFSGWNKPGGYEKSFKRLLRDLNTTERPPLPSHLTSEVLRERKIESLQTQLSQHYDNLHTLQIDATEYGAPFEVPLKIRNQITALEEIIDNIEDELEKLSRD